eukprot:UN01728
MFEALHIKTLVHTAELMKICLKGFTLKHCTHCGTEEDLFEALHIKNNCTHYGTEGDLF